MAEEKKKRIELLDALRGFGVLVMVMHHILYDLIVFCGARFQLFGNVIFDSLHYIAAGSFLVLAGISSRFSRSNVKRGVKLFLVAMCFTVVTSLPMIDLPIRFGVLHLLGASMVFYGLTAEVWNRIPRTVMPVLCVALLVGSALAVKYIEVSPALAHLWKQQIHIQSLEITIVWMMHMERSFQAQMVEWLHRRCSHLNQLKLSLSVHLKSCTMER